jgi:hypothetical protein
LKLERDERVLFGPQPDQGLWEPGAQGSKLVHPGVAGGTKRNQAGRIVAAGLTVVDVQPPAVLLRPATLAGAAVASEDSIAEAVKVGSGSGGSRRRGRVVLTGSEDRTIPVTLSIRYFIISVYE